MGCMKNQICKIETLLNFFIWTGSVLYSLYKLYEAQETYKSEVTSVHDEIIHGWAFLNRTKDVSDFEWRSWKRLMARTWMYFGINFIVAECLRTWKQEFIPCWYLGFSVFFLLQNYGIFTFFLLISQPLVYLCLLIFVESYWVIWLWSLILLFITNTLKVEYYFWDYLFHLKLLDEDITMILIGFAWVETRCISFSLEYFKRIQKDYKAIPKIMNINKQVFIVNAFSYSLYLPLLFTGPIVMFDEYEKSLEATSSSLKRKIVLFTKHFLCYVGLYYLLELLMHVYHFGAMKDTGFINQLPSWALYGGGIWMAISFHMKYVMLYGIAGIVGSLDNIDVPPQPRCIARVHLYSDMWKYFDVGLHKFLVRYIYKPIIKQLPSNIYSMDKFIASFICFTFIYVWHGIREHILIWTALNYFGIVVESLSTSISQTSYFILFKCRKLRTEANYRRFKCIVSAPLLLMSALSNFYFFGGLETGHLYVERILNGPILDLSMLLICCYTCCQVSTSLKNVPARNLKN